MNLLKKLLRIAPQLAKDGAYYPSPLALKLATVPTSNYDGGDYPNRYTGGDLRVLMICTEQRNMTMANGKMFSTGNHPIEMALPMLHLINAGFAIDVMTPTGAPAAIERWGLPQKDKAIQNLFSDFATALEKPGSLADFAANQLTQDTSYAAIFIPGGHGAMLGLPSNEDLGKVLRWAHASGLHTITLCHGTGALLAAKTEEGFIYDGYEMTIFPDSVDKQSPLIGYLPGHMPWYVEELIKTLGAKIMNTKADDRCHVDRRLVTGASPKASNALGRLAAETVLNSLKPQE